VKVSKPVIIFGIVVLLLAGYIHFFTGKKKTAKPVPAPPVASQTQPVQQGQQQIPQAAARTGQTPPAKTIPSESDNIVAQTKTPAPAMEPDFERVKTAWVRNPFILPQFKEDKRKDIPPAVRLLGIFEKGKDRVAIIDHEVVRRGDMIGDEKVLEIEKDKVILIRDNTKRILSLTAIENMIREEEPKTKETEKGK
jgi:hypothetical protein